MGFRDYIQASFKCPYCGHSEENYKWQISGLLVEAGSRIPHSGYLAVESGWIEIWGRCKRCSKEVKAAIRIENGELTNKIFYKYDVFYFEKNFGTKFDILEKIIKSLGDRILEILRIHPPMIFIYPGETTKYEIKNGKIILKIEDWDAEIIRNCLLEALKKIKLSKLDELKNNIRI